MSPLGFETCLFLKIGSGRFSGCETWHNLGFGAGRLGSSQGAPGCLSWEPLEIYGAEDSGLPTDGALSLECFSKPLSAWVPALIQAPFCSLLQPATWLLRPQAKVLFYLPAAKLTHSTHALAQPL